MQEISNTIDSRRGIRRVAIIGMGAVGSAFAYALIHEGRVRELLFVDKDKRRAEGQMMDLSHCLPWGRPIKMEIGDLDSAASCDMVVITAGVAQKTGESRIDLVKRNADIFAEFFPRLPEANPRGLFVIITNPVDVMTRLALNLSHISPEQVFGTGTTLDTGRFRFLLSHHLKVDPRNIHAYVIGEHGDSEVLVWSRAHVGPFSLEEYGDLTGRPITAEVQRDVTAGVKTAAYEIIERKGATNYAIGLATEKLFESVSFNQGTLQTVSRALSGAYGFDDLCLSTPCRLQRDGALEPLEIPLSPEEHKALMRSAETLDEVYQSLKV